MAFEIQLAVQSCAAWAPGLQVAEHWRAWADADAPGVPAGEGVPALPQVAPMARRRLERLGRMALQAAFEAADDHPVMPSVFVSRRGDAGRSFELLSALVAGEGLSPTGFGLSVHNAIAAQYSMVRSDRSAYSALAAGAAGVENGLVEAAGWLAEGAPAVLLVVFETGVPAAFRAFNDEPDPDFAWAWRLAPAGAPGRTLRLRGGEIAAAGAVAQPADGLPAALRPLRHYLRDAREWCSAVEGMHWEWTLHD